MENLTSNNIRLPMAAPGLHILGQTKAPYVLRAIKIVNDYKARVLADGGTVEALPSVQEMIEYLSH
jgi:hypothetical protein